MRSARGADLDSPGVLIVLGLFYPLYRPSVRVFLGIVYLFGHFFHDGLINEMLHTIGRLMEMHLPVTIFILYCQ